MYLGKLQKRWNIYTDRQGRDDAVSISQFGRPTRNYKIESTFFTDQGGKSVENQVQ
jgi:hypothetical protein